jgi:hypothetical protein
VFLAVAVMAGLAGGSHGVALAEVTVVQLGQVPSPAHAGATGASAATGPVAVGEHLDASAGGLLGVALDTTEVLLGSGLVAMGAGMSAMALGW